MAISEFRYNKRRGHYSYIFGRKGNMRKNVLLSTNEYRVKKIKSNNCEKLIVNRNIPLYKHPNPNCTDKIYVMPRIYNDNKNVFGKLKRTWSFDIFDKRKIKRLKKRK